MLKVCHLAPFAPHRAGIYEAARDLARADVLAGHDVAFVDTGATPAGSGTREEARVGARDERGDWTLATASPEVADAADVLVFHTGVPDHWVVTNQAPIVWIVHGRPLACFRPEQNGAGSSYSLYAQVSRWPRSKAMVHFWPEFRVFWDVVFPDGKQVALDFPPIDPARFAPAGPTHEFAPEHKGRWNGLLCDSWREDVDLYEVMHGALEAARRLPGLKWHLYALEAGEGGRVRPCWEHLLTSLRKAGALGEVCGRMPDMDRVYRACDVLLTPHRIVTRCIGEAQSCGTAVVAAEGCAVTPWVARPDEPLAVARAVEKALLDGRRWETARTAHERYSLERCGRRLAEVYRQALAGGAA